MGWWHRETRRKIKIKEEGLASHVRNPEKYPDCRTDLISGAATQTFAPGGKHPRAATEKCVGRKGSEASRVRRRCRRD